jgi:hypothetical protein
MGKGKGAVNSGGAPALYEKGGRCPGAIWVLSLVPQVGHDFGNQKRIPVFELKGRSRMIRIHFLAALVACCVLFPLNLIAAEWDLVDEDFSNDGDFGAFTTVEHTGDNRTGEVKGGAAILKRIGDPGDDIGPTIRAYFDDPGTSEFIVSAKVDIKSIGDDGHFIMCMRINGFEYLPTIAADNIGDHESPEQWNTGIRTQEVAASPLGPHEYIIVGKSQDAYDLYYDGELVIKDGVTRSLGGEAWEVAQAMIHLRKGSDLEIHIDAVRVKKGTDGLEQILAAAAVTPKNKLALTWGKVKEQ